MMFMDGVTHTVSLAFSKLYVGTRCCQDAFKIGLFSDLLWRAGDCSGNE